MQNDGVGEHPPQPEDSSHQSSPSDTRKDAVSRNGISSLRDVQSTLSNMLASDAKLATAAMKAMQNIEAAARGPRELADQMSKLRTLPPVGAMFQVPRIQVPSFDLPVVLRENEVSTNKDVSTLRTYLDTKVDELVRKLDEQSEKYDASLAMYHDLTQRYGDLTQKYQGLELNLDAKIEELGKFQDQTAELRNKTEHLESQLAGTEHRSIEVVGLLSSIVALVLVSATTANSQSSPVSAYLIIVVTAAGLTVFACLLHAFFQPSSPRPFWRYWLPFAVIPALAILAAGLLLFWTTYIGVLP